MSLEADFRAAMLADAGVTALIEQRLYAVQKAAKCRYPAVAYQRISTQRQYRHGPVGGNQGTFGWARFQLKIWGDGPTGFEQVLAVADALIAALQTFNLSAQPGSPAVLRQAPNYVLQQRMTDEPQPDQTLAVMILDVKVISNAV